MRARVWCQVRQAIRQPSVGRVRASWVRLWRDLRGATLSRGIFAPEPAYAILGAFWRVWCGAGVSTSGAGGGGGRRLTTSPAWLYLG